MAHAGKGPRFTFFGGKGGVGKTTCAAAAAVRAASEGGRVLLVSTDPAHSLSDALGLELRAEPRPVRDLPGIGELHAAELDADKALSRWLGEREDAIRAIADRGTYLDAEDIDRFLELSFPGVDELVGLIELLRLSRFRELDDVVVDTAPTGHTLRLLEMPDTLQRVSEILDGMHEKHRFLATSLGGGYRPDFADETIASIEREATELRELLRDPRRAGFTWVTTAEELPFRESEDGIAAISEMGVDVSVVVVNRVWPAPDRPCELCTPRFEEEHRWRRAIFEAFDAQEILEVPARLEEPVGAAALLELAMSVTWPDLRKPRRRKAAPSRRERSPLEDTPTMRLQGVSAPIAPTVRLVLFGGKGGVGKTTAAAACAIELAEARRKDRVLLLSTDPAHSLGDALGAESVSDEARPVAGGPKNLFVRELDAPAAWEIERDRYRRSIDDLFDSIFGGKMDAKFDRAVLEDLLDLAPPGIDELLAIVAILDALVAPEPLSPPSAPPTLDLPNLPWGLEGLPDGPITGDEPTLAVRSIRFTEPREVRVDDAGDPPGSTRDAGAADEAHENGDHYDLVVVDTAPTGHTLRLLALPGKALEWVHALMSVILKYRSVVGLGELATDLTSLARRLRALIALLSDPTRCAFVVVSRPAALPRLETERLARELRRLKVPVSAIVANAVTEPSCARCTQAAAVERGELEKLERLAVRAARSPRLLAAPAVYPGPHGPFQLGLWRSAWTERIPTTSPLSTRSLPPDAEPSSPVAPRVPESGAPRDVLPESEPGAWSDAAPASSQETPEEDPETEPGPPPSVVP